MWRLAAPASLRLGASPEPRGSRSWPGPRLWGFSFQIPSTGQRTRTTRPFQTCNTSSAFQTPPPRPQRRHPPFPPADTHLHEPTVWFLAGIPADLYPFFSLAKQSLRDPIHGGWPSPSTAWGHFCRPPKTEDLRRARNGNRESLWPAVPGDS